MRQKNDPNSRVAVEMALQQTIIDQEKHRLKGIMSLADVNTAVNRWIVTTSHEITHCKLILFGISTINSSSIDTSKLIQVQL